jgi:hypothetical protein
VLNRARWGQSRGLGEGIEQLLGAGEPPIRADMISGCVVVGSCRRWTKSWVMRFFWLPLSRMRVANLCLI